MEGLKEEFFQVTKIKNIKIRKFKLSCATECVNAVLNYFGLLKNDASKIPNEFEEYDVVISSPMFPTSIFIGDQINGLEKLGTEERAHEWNFLIELFSRYGVSTWLLNKVRFEDLTSYLKRKISVITKFCHLKDCNLYGSKSLECHFCVACGLDEENQKVIVENPGDGSYFYLDKDNFYMSNGRYL